MKDIIKKYLKEKTRYIDDNDKYRFDKSVHPSQRRSPNWKKVKHDFKIGDKVILPAIPSEIKPKLRYGKVIDFDDKRVLVIGHNIYFPKSKEWFFAKDIKHKSKKGKD